MTGRDRADLLRNELGQRRRTARRDRQREMDTKTERERERDKRESGEKRKRSRSRGGLSKSKIRRALRFGFLDAECDSTAPTTLQLTGDAVNCIRWLCWESGSVYSLTVTLATYFPNLGPILLIPILYSEYTLSPRQSF